MEIQLNPRVAYLIKSIILLTIFATICYGIVWHREIVAAVEFIEEVI